MRFITQKLKNLFGTSTLNCKAKRQRSQFSVDCEGLEDRLLLTIDFQFNYLASTPANIGFNHPTQGQARQDALQAVANQLGAQFSNNAVIQLDVTSVEDSQSDTLASAGSELVDNGNGFNSEVIRRKVLTGIDANGNTTDGVVEVNWGINWETSLDPNDVDNTEFDFVSTMLHELTHAMGFGSLIAQNGEDIFGTTPGSPGAWGEFDRYITDANETAVINSTTFVLDANAWNTNSVGGNSANGTGLFFNGTNAKAANGGNPVGLYTPSPWEDGSSVSHTDDENPALANTMMLAATAEGLGARAFTDIECGIMMDIGYAFAPMNTMDDVFVRDATTGRWRVGASNGTQFGNTTGFTSSTSVTWQFLEGDFNNDDKTDVAGLADNGQWWVKLANGTAFDTTFWATWNGTAGWQNLQVGDFDNDGDDDVLGQTSTGQWWLGRSNGASGFVTSYVGQWSPTGWVDIVSGDFNNDNRMDLAGLTDSGQWWVGISNGNTVTTSFWTQWNAAAGWQDLRVGDFDNDDDDDIFARTSTGQWWIARPTGASFLTTYGTTWNEALGWQDVKIGDFDGDNRADIAGRTNGNTWFVATSTGVRLVNKQWAQWNAASTWSTAVGDFDGDGKDDIAGLIASDGSWWVALAQANQRFQNTYFGSWGSLISSVDHIGAGDVV